MFCKQCGTALGDNAKYCPKCGTPVVQRQTAQTVLEPPQKRTQPPEKPKKNGTKILAIILSAVLVLGACSGVFVFRDEIMSLISGQKQFDENHVGEIYYQEIDEEHVATDDSGIMYADNEILVVAKENTKKSQIEKLAKKYDAEIVGWIEQTGDYQWQMDSIYSIEELKNIVFELENENIIDSASVNYINEMSNSIEYNVNYGKEWETSIKDSNDIYGKAWGVKAINAPAAWNLLNENKDKISPVKVGLIDSGFDINHIDLRFKETFYNTSPDDHGTIVAGIMAANSDNNEGICGVYPYGNGNLYGASWVGIHGYSENLISCMREKCAYSELILRNVKVINCSCGLTPANAEVELYNDKIASDEKQEILKDANVLGEFLDRLINVHNYDFIVIQASGNESNKNYARLKIDKDKNGNVINISYDNSGDVKSISYDDKKQCWCYNDIKITGLGDKNDNNVKAAGHLGSKFCSFVSAISEEQYPDVYNRVIVVGSTNEFGLVSDFSNTGSRVDIYAPGEKIYSTLPYDKYGTKTSSGDYISGTSVAAPHVAGVAGSIWAANNNLTGAEVKEIICSTANHLINQVDAKSAVEKALGIEKEKTTEPQNGGILCWVVNKDNEDDKIEGATVTATNVDTGVPESTKTDSNGHFELFLPEGNYTLTVTAKEYDDYTYNGTIEVKNNGVNYLDDWIKMKRSKGSISGTVVDELGNPIKNAHIIANQTINNTLADKKATTDSNGYFKVECNTGNYKIKVTADGYEEYNSDEVINVEKDFDTILDTIQLKKIKKEYTESDLKEKVLAESGGNILSWFYEDYDGNGTKEAYSLVDIGTGGSEGDLTVYFIDADGNIKIMYDNFWHLSYYDNMTKCTEYKGKKFFSVDLSGGGSGYSTFLASVKDGNAYELDISNSLQGFFVKNGICYTTENDFSSGIHTYPEVELIYNSSTQQFSKGNRIISEENNTISDWKSAYIEVLSNLNNSSARFTTAYIDEDDIPELIVAYNSSHAAGCEIYTYYDGKVSKLEANSTNGEFGFGSSGEILYLPYKNLFDSRYYGMGSNSDSLYRINNGNAQSECNLQYNDYFTTVRVIEFKIDGIEKNENEYWDKYNSYEINSMVSANYDDMIEVNSTDISNYFN